MQQEFDTPGMGETSVSPLARASESTVVAALVVEWWLTLWLVVNTFAAMVCGLIFLGLHVARFDLLALPPDMWELAISVGVFVLFVGWAILCSWCKRGIVQGRRAAATMALILTGTAFAVVTSGFAIMLVVVVRDWGDGASAGVAILLIVAFGPLAMLLRTLVALRRLRQCLREEEGGGFPVEVPLQSRAAMGRDE